MYACMHVLVYTRYVCWMYYVGSCVLLCVCIFVDKNTCIACFEDLSKMMRTRVSK